MHIEIIGQKAYKARVPNDRFRGLFFKGYDNEVVFYVKLRYT